MAITSIATPQVLVPAYNKIKFIYNSTNKALLGFKYIFDVYASGTINKIGEYKVMPSFFTGYGEVDLSKLLQAKVSYDLNLANNTAYNATDSHYKYDVKVGEEYLTNVSYTSALTQYLSSPYLGKVRVNLTHTFVVGNQIKITQADLGVANPNLEGLFTVLAVGVGYIVVNSLWSLVTNANIDGTITFADGRKTITRDIIHKLNSYVFNGAIQWTSMPSYNYQEYRLNNNSDKFLTSYPQNNMYMTLSQDMWVNAVANGVLSAPDTILFTNDQGNQFYKDVTSTDFVSGISVGPNNHGNLTLLAGSGNFIEPTTTSYIFQYVRNNVPSSAKYTVTLDRRIRSKEYSILFLDRMGSWGSFVFTGRAYEKGNVIREEFNRDVKGYVNSSNQWTYNTQDRGMTATYISTNNTIDLNTDYMNEDMAKYFTELISSPYTLYKVSNYLEDCEVPSSTEYISCTVVTSSFEIFKQRNKNLIKQSIQIKLANNDIINA